MAGYRVLIQSHARRYASRMATTMLEHAEAWSAISTKIGSGPSQREVGAWMEKKPICPLVCASAVCTSILYSLGKLPSMWHVGLSVGNIAYQKHDILVAPRVRACAVRDPPDDVEK